MSKAPLHIKGVLSTKKHKFNLNPEMFELHDIPVSVICDGKETSVSHVTFPFIIQINDAEYELDKNAQLRFKRFTKRYTGRSSVSLLSSFHISGNGKVRRNPSMSIGCKDLSSVIFNGVKAKVNIEPITNKQYCVFIEDTKSLES